MLFLVQILVIISHFTLYIHVCIYTCIHTYSYVTVISDSGTLVTETLRYPRSLHAMAGLLLKFYLLPLEAECGIPSLLTLALLI